jgi:hypothetical protein
MVYGNIDTAMTYGSTKAAMPVGSMNGIVPVVILGVRHVRHVIVCPLHTGVAMA